MSNIDLLTPNQVITRLNIPSSTLYRWISEGKFPRPIKLGDRKTAFREKDIQEWIESKNETDSKTAIQ
ncbi:helix-turn-helix transcriptional regulator [Gracilimonas sp. BCB1]|uniref:helix-turn-helix transcriptional regulator n=1 Tax=Gracilimonas sp. BCB1 TaxID=3152362 RepID=UPI0032D93239